MAEVKAASVCYLKQKIRDLGTNVEGDFLKGLPPQTAQQYLTALPLSWVPIEAAATIYKNGAPVAFPGNPLAIRQLGHETATTSYTGIYRMLLRVATIPFILERAARLWRNHHTDGDITTEMGDDHSAMVTVTNYPDLLEPVRELVAGYLTGLCILTGSKAPRVKRDDRPPTWRWIVTWNDR